MLLKLSSSFLLNRCSLPSFSYRPIKRWVAPTLRELERRRKKIGPQAPVPRSAFLEWNYEAELFGFGKRLNEEFQESLLRQAFLHRSYVLQEERRQKELGIEKCNVNVEDNRVLAEEGEELIKDYLHSYLCSTLPYIPEEGICAIRDYLMTVSILSSVSLSLGTKDLILSADFPAERETLALTLKAVVGALKRSSGVERTHEFIHDFIITQLSEKDIYELWCVPDPVDLLSRLAKQLNLPEPEERLLREAGPNTVLSVYYVGFYSNKRLLGYGYGESVEIAKKMAAHSTLRRMFCLEENRKPLPFSKKPICDRKSNPKVSQWTAEATKNVVNFQ